MFNLKIDYYYELKQIMEIDNQEISLFFIRHSERADQVFEEGITIEQQNDPPLTTRGVAYAQNTGEYMKKWLQENQYEEVHIVSSPFLRCLQTAAGIA